MPGENRATLAGLFVGLVWLGMLVFQLVVVGRTVSRVPFFDEFCNLGILFGDDTYTVWAYWDQHNEHRIPLPKLAYVLINAAAGYDLRAAPVANALLLSVVAAALLLVVRMARGRWAVTDAVIPLVLMHVGHWANIVFGFQLQFVLSTALALGVLGLIVGSGKDPDTGRVIGVGSLTLLLPLCGANGVVFAPFLGVYLLTLGGSAVRSAPARGWLGIAFGLAAIGMVPLYFAGLQPTAHHPKTHDPFAVVNGTLDFFAIVFGPVAQAVHVGDGHWPSVLGMGMAALTAFTLVRLAGVARDPEHRAAALGVGAVLLGLCVLGLGLGYGRGGDGQVLSCHRYITLAAPLAVAVYLAWAVLIPTGRRVVGPLMLVVALASVWPNAAAGVENTRWVLFQVKRVEWEIRQGMPVSFVVDRNPALYPGGAARVRYWFERMKARGVKPFDGLQPDPPMTEHPIPVVVGRVDGLTPDGAGFRLDGGTGGLALNLPRFEHVYAVRLVYEASFPIPHYPLGLISWEPGGVVPPRPGYGILGQLHPTGGPNSTLVLIDKPTDSLRLDLVQPGSTVRVHALSLVTRGD